MKHLETDLSKKVSGCGKKNFPKFSQHLISIYFSKFGKQSRSMSYANSSVKPDDHITFKAKLYHLPTTNTL